MGNKLLVFLILSGQSLLGAKDSVSHYMVFLKDKAQSTYSIERPWEFLSVESIDRRAKFGLAVDESDLPVSESYIRAIAFGRDIRVKASSKWLNAVLIICNEPSGLEHVRQLPCVKKIEFLGSFVPLKQEKSAGIADSFYERSRKLTELKKSYDFSKIDQSAYGHGFDNCDPNNITYLHKRGYTAKGVHIAVFDAGFHDAYKTRGMEDLLEPQNIVRDFVDDDASVWEDDKHGANVLGFMKSFAPGYYIGSAPLARYTLCRTEIAHAELPLEEINWLLAAEFADSLGVDMIIGSLGYFEFDNNLLNHPYRSFDGKTLIATRAANTAHSKGIAIICSAGNSGEQKWGKIGTPADAPGAIAIGAINKEGFRAGFSSRGPSSDGRIKPDFMSPGHKVRVNSPNGVYFGNGTSYATPIFAGGFACLMQFVPDYHPDSIFTKLKASATHYRHADTLLGYGIPDFGLSLCRIGYWNKGDTQDVWWQKANSVFYQDLNIYFWSYTDQTIEVCIKVAKGKKLKKVRKFRTKVAAGKWFVCDELYDLLADEKYNKVKQIELSIETERQTYNRGFTF